jgi:CDP-paratose 2-epimerase
LKLLITGICGFLGSTLAKLYKTSVSGAEVFGVDNFSRAGCWLNKEPLEKLGVKVIHGDMRNASDVEALPDSDWVIDAAANPSVLAGVAGRTSSRQLVEYNLGGTLNLLEYCKLRRAGFVLLSTSRVYSILPLANIELSVKSSELGQKLVPTCNQAFPEGLSAKGVSEDYSTAPPVSLYGSTKVASEHLTLEYGSAFDFPVWINRCGVMAGAGQFGHPAQGIFAFWIHSYREGKDLKYIGFGGKGHQVRDALHPRDLLPLLQKQMAEKLVTDKPRTINVSGGLENSMSLNELSGWCQHRFKDVQIESLCENRAFDVPWMVLDSSAASTYWGWRPETPIETVLTEIADFAENHPGWIDVSRNW